VSVLQKEEDLTFNVNVCTTGYWPSKSASPGVIPRDLVNCCEKFKKFYLNQHSNHKLEFRLEHGQAEVQVNFNPKTKRALVVTTHQVRLLNFLQRLHSKKINK